MNGNRPYLSVVVTARNDDHGGNLLRRMQTFVNAFIGQCKQHALDAELVLVEWNPPEDRESLVRALHWPADPGPCCVRVIAVPAELHRRYKNAETLPLYQMIAKNVGIRRARGRFILATNIDIIFSDELMRFVAERRLEKGRMYRVDRYDVAADVPVDASVDEQLAYCRSHLIRINAREGTFPLTPQGWRALAQEDIATAGSGIHFGAGWFAPQRYSSDEPVFRWAGDDAEFVVRGPDNPYPMLTFDLEPGPSIWCSPFTLQLLDGAGCLVSETSISGRTAVPFRLPVLAGETKTFRLHVIGGGRPVPKDPHVLSLRVFQCAWGESVAVSPGRKRPPTLTPDVGADVGGHRLLTQATLSTRIAGLWSKLAVRRHTLQQVRAVPQASSQIAAEGAEDIVNASAGLALGSGWYSRESSRGEVFRWVQDEAELIVFTPQGPARMLVAKVQAGPGVGFRRSLLQVRDQRGQIVATAELDRVQSVKFSFPWRPGRVQVFSFRLEGGGAPVPAPNDPRTLRFRVFRFAWSPMPGEPVPAEKAVVWDSKPCAECDVVGPEAGFYWGSGWEPPDRDANGEAFRWTTNDTEIVVRAPNKKVGVLGLEIEPGPGTGFGPFELRVLDSSGRTLAKGLVTGRQQIHMTLPLWPLRTHVFRLHAESVEQPAKGEASTRTFRLFRCGWVDGPIDVLSPGLGLAAGAGWSALQCDRGRFFRRVQSSAELLVKTPPVTNPVIELEVEPERTMGAELLNFEVRDAAGETIARVPVRGRQIIHFALPWNGAASQSLHLHVGPMGSAPGAPCPSGRQRQARKRGRSGPELRVLRCEWSQLAAVGGTAEGPRNLNFRAAPRLPPDRDIVPANSDIALGKGWYAAELSSADVFRWATNGAEIIVRAENTRIGTLLLELEAGPSFGQKPFVLQVLNRQGKALFGATVAGRQTLRVNLPVCFEKSSIFRLHSDGEQLPLPDDPRFLTFRVFRCSWEPATQGPAPPLPAAERETAEIISPADLHTNACGDFTLMAREHWHDLRGYPEFDMFSFNIDSVLCYAAHHGGAREQVLEDPVRIYHIEHGVGSGWTPEGQEKLFERLRAKGLFWIEYPEVANWAIHMRRLDVPMIFNRGDWGLSGVELPETVLQVQKGDLGDGSRRGGLPEDVPEKTLP